MAVGAALFLASPHRAPASLRPGARTRRPPAAQGDARDPAATQSLPPAGAQAREQLLDLADDLKLAPAQRAAWAAYSTRVQQLADDVARNRNALRFPKGTAPEQLEFVAETLRNPPHGDRGHHRQWQGAVRVAAEQKEIADNRLARLSIRSSRRYSRSPAAKPKQAFGRRAPGRRSRTLTHRRAVRDGTSGATRDVAAAMPPPATP
jgi:hypothetical protein